MKSGTAPTWAARRLLRITCSRLLKPGIDPLSPENVLVFACSVVTGTPISGWNRYTVAAKSPLTHAFGESEAGGLLRPGAQVRGFRRHRHPGPGRQTDLSLHQGRRGPVPGREGRLGPGQFRNPAAHPGGGRGQAGAGGVHRPGRRAPDPFCQRQQRRRALQRPHRHGSGPGIQKPQGRRRARHPTHGIGRTGKGQGDRPLAQRPHQDPSAQRGADQFRHTGAGQGAERHRHPADPQLPGRGFRRGRQAQRRRLCIHSALLRHLLDLRRQVQAPRGPGRREIPAQSQMGRSRIRDHRGVRFDDRQRQPAGRGPGQPALQSLRHGHHDHGQS